MTTAVTVTFDEAELAVRLAEIAIGKPRPKGLTAGEALDVFSAGGLPEYAETLVLQAKVAIGYFHECCEAAGAFIEEGVLQ